MPKCVICGAEFPHEMVKPKQSEKEFPREICLECASEKPKPAVKREPTCPSIAPYCELAGCIERLVLWEHSHLYSEALKSAAYSADLGCLTNAEEAFLMNHNRVAKRESVYHSAMTMGNFYGLLDAARRSVEKSSPQFAKLRENGYDIFKRAEEVVK